MPSLPHLDLVEEIQYIFLWFKVCFEFLIKLVFVIIASVSTKRATHPVP